MLLGLSPVITWVVIGDKLCKSRFVDGRFESFKAGFLGNFFGHILDNKHKIFPWQAKIIAGFQSRHKTLVQNSGNLITFSFGSNFSDQIGNVDPFPNINIFLFKIATLFSAAPIECSRPGKFVLVRLRREGKIFHLHCLKLRVKNLSRIRTKLIINDSADSIADHRIRQAI